MNAGKSGDAEADVAVASDDLTGGIVQARRAATRCCNAMRHEHVRLWLGGDFLQTVL